MHTAFPHLKPALCIRQTWVTSSGLASALVFRRSRTTWPKLRLRKVLLVGPCIFSYNCSCDEPRKRSCTWNRMCLHLSLWIVSPNVIKWEEEIIIHNLRNEEPLYSLLSIKLCIQTLKQLYFFKNEIIAFVEYQGHCFTYSLFSHV